MAEGTRLPSGRHRLPGRAGPKQQDDRQQNQESEQSEEDAATTGHDRRLPRRKTGSNRRLPPPNWIERNRRWFIPWLSALICFIVEIVAAFTKPLPESAHVVMIAFIGFAAQRNRARRLASEAIEARLAEYAARHRLPVGEVRDEFDVFTASLRRQLPPGGDHDD